MEAMELSRHRQFEEETGIKVDAGNPAPLADDDAPAGTPREPAGGDDDTINRDSQLATQLSDSPTLLDKTEGVMVKVKVDGEEQEVELSKVISQFQKGSAADKRLEEATRLLKEAQVRAESLPAPAANSQATPAATNAEGDELFAKAKNALSLLYEGDEDAAARALVEAIRPSGGAQPTQGPVDVGAIATAVTQRLAVDSAFAHIRSHYPDLLSDPDLDTLTVMKTKAKEAEGMPRSEAMLSAADEVYKLIGKKSPGRPAEDQTRTTRTEKLANKAGLDNIKPAGAYVASSTQAGEPEDASAAIRAMAASRLGQSMPRTG